MDGLLVLGRTFGGESQGYWSSFAASPACTLERKLIATRRYHLDDAGPGPHGGCSLPSMVTGTASTNDSPDGAITEYGKRCISILSMTLTWST